MKRPGSLRSGSGPRRSHAIARGSGPRPSPIDRRRKPRSRSEFARIYGSKARVKWVAALPCIVPFCAGGMVEGHHVISDGTSRKADACWIVPLCFSHHREVHNQGVASFGAKYGLDLRYCAARTEAAWRAFVGVAA